MTDLDDETITEPWPPPAAPEDWYLVRLPIDEDGRVGPTGPRRPIRVRDVQLWGRTVMVDEAGDVFCDDCWRFLPADVLGQIDNSHRVGLTGRAAGRLLPMSDDDSAFGTRREEDS